MRESIFTCSKCEANYTVPDNAIDECPVCGWKHRISTREDAERLASELRDALNLILPLARDYAREKRRTANADSIREAVKKAEAVLAKIEVAP
jgi:predicted  nucleic acid-binding Zn-ribbon protein